MSALCEAQQAVSWMGRLRLNVMAQLSQISKLNVASCQNNEGGRPDTKHMLVCQVLCCLQNMFEDMQLNLCW